MSAPQVSILISVYGELACTRKCLERLERTLRGRVEYEVLIVNDASKDGTADFLDGLRKPYRIFHNREKQGFARNNNRIAGEAKGDYLCFLNNDVFVDDDWLVPMLAVFESKEKVGMVGNVQRLAGSRRFDHMGVVFAPQGNPRHYGQGFWHRPFKGEVREWSAVTAACCLAKREVFLELGGFDEAYLNGCEDVDLCLRMTEAGLAHFVVHDSVVEHVKGASEGRKLKNEENARMLQEKWGGCIRARQAISDRIAHARTYLFRGLTRPWSVNFGKFVEAVGILLRRSGTK